MSADGQQLTQPLLADEGAVQAAQQGMVTAVSGMVACHAWSPSRLAWAVGKQQQQWGRDPTMFLSFADCKLQEKCFLSVGTSESSDAYKKVR